MKIEAADLRSTVNAKFCGFGLILDERPENSCQLVPAGSTKVCVVERGVTPSANPLLLRTGQNVQRYFFRKKRL